MTREWELAKEVGELQDVPVGFSRLVRGLLIREIKRAILAGKLPQDALRGGGSPHVATGAERGEGDACRLPVGVAVRAGWGS